MCVCGGGGCCYVAVCSENKSNNVGKWSIQLSLQVTTTEEKGRVWRVGEEMEGRILRKLKWEGWGFCLGWGWGQCSSHSYAVSRLGSMRYKLLFLHNLKFRCTKLYFSLCMLYCLSSFIKYVAIALVANTIINTSNFLKSKMSYFLF